MVLFRNTAYAPIFCANATVQFCQAPLIIIYIFKLIAQFLLPFFLTVCLFLREM